MYTLDLSEGRSDDGVLAKEGKTMEVCAVGSAISQTKDLIESISIK